MLSSGIVLPTIKCLLDKNIPNKSIHRSWKTPRHPLRHSPAVTFSLDGRHAITGSYDATIKLWNVADGTAVQTLTGQRGMVNTLAVSPRDGTLASGSSVGEIFLWEAEPGVS